MKKANHKHNYNECIFEFDGTTFNITNGFVSKTQFMFGTYCDICGKIGIKNFWRNSDCLPENFGETLGGLTEEETKQLRTETRTLPTFHIGKWTDAKFVSL